MTTSGTMSKPLSSIALIGSTGFVGSHILSTLQQTSTPPIIHTISRRALPASSQTINSHIDSDTSKWPTALQCISPPPQALISALGTTRGNAGSFAAQRAIDYDLNLALAQAAHESGVGIYVLISSAGTSPSSPLPYSKMKGELDAAVKKVGFTHTVILRPGLLLGDRQEKRLGEGAARKLFGALSTVAQPLVDRIGQEASVVARAAVAAVQACAEGKREPGVWVLEQNDVVQWGRIEWKAAATT